MNFEELNEWIGILFEKGKKEEIQGKLAKFKADEFLIDQLGNYLNGRELKNMSLDYLVPVVNILDTVVSPQYPVEDPTQYDSLYVPAISNHDTDWRFSAVLTHLNEIKTIEPSLVLEGITKNPSFRYTPSYAGNDPRHYIFNQNSYLKTIEDILLSRDRRDEAFIGIKKRLGNFKAHLEDLKNRKIDIKKLFGAEYTLILTALDAHNQKDPGDFPEKSAQVAGLLEKLDARGFDIFHQKSMKNMVEYLGSEKNRQLELLSTYLSPEAIMYTSGFHLK